MLAIAPPAAAQTSVNDVEDEVMCPICGTLLELAESPQAERERALVKRLIAEGRDKSEVEDALVAQYGPAVLALPEGKGFDLSAYLVPAVGFVVAAIALAFGVARWRRGSPGPGADGAATDAAPSDEDAKRLDDDLARYDL
ncbi:MAG TPA: cytochrome c-type biogenesis protein CcmH [Solirubrobacterales bacterium]|nr:cytochrome c-type biogenesis protein CcmH [Solirubrobacterales bacterium]